MEELLKEILSELKEMNKKLNEIEEDTCATKACIKSIRRELKKND